MVGKGSHCRMFLPAFILAILLLPLFVSAAGAQVLQEEGSFTLEEETRVEINEVGDAHLTDTMTYDPDWFDEYGYIFDDNPSLLNRSYRSDVNVGEFDNFDVDVSYQDSTVTVSFDTPGYAYNKGDVWWLPGYDGYELTSRHEDRVVLEGSGVLNSEFTLFEDMPLEQKLIIYLPTGAKNASFDEKTGDIKYELPYVVKEGFLTANKTVLAIIFALIMALSLFLFIFAVTRKAALPEAATVAEGQPPQIPIAPATPKFCKRCGSPRESPEAKFCRNCGASYQKWSDV